MINTRRHTKVGIRLFALVLGLVFAPTLVLAASVAPPQSHPYGRSYAEWAAAWWQWALETSASENPLLDVTGEFCAVAQTAKVWFLAGSIDDLAVSRSCTISTGTALLLPLANSFFGAFLNDPPEQRTEAFVRAQVACVEGALISLTIDGIPVPNLQRFFERSTLFSVQLPPDNIFGVDESTVPELLLSASVDAGYYVIIRPLPPGTHTIHLVTIPGTSCAIPQDVTYTITVEPGK